jgi:hypothetical protein
MRKNTSTYMSMNMNIITTTIIMSMGTIMDMGITTIMRKAGIGC